MLENGPVPDELVVRVSGFDGNTGRPWALKEIMLGVVGTGHSVSPLL